ncbi:MAG: DUF433 domain-containing protein [Verrucomicrobiales bacterium]|nr:DUF433 domain-containing protein [Verrucomicrobiales bacterium]
MTQAVAHPHILRQGGEPACLERLSGVRVADVVLPHLAHGWSADELQRQYPHLTLGEIHACLGYYFDNPTEIDALIASEKKLADRLREGFARSPLARRLQAAKAS